MPHVFGAAPAAPHGASLHGCVVTQAHTVLATHSSAVPLGSLSSEHLILELHLIAQPVSASTLQSSAWHAALLKTVLPRCQDVVFRLTKQCFDCARFESSTSATAIAPSAQLSQCELHNSQLAPHWLCHDNVSLSFVLRCAVDRRAPTRFHFSSATVL